MRGLVMALVVGLGSVAAAQSAPEINRARQHFEAGRALYNLGNYTDAIREFSAGYQLVPRPQFLLNLGQAYRKQNDLAHAREMFRKFLTVAPPGDPDRGQARVILDEIEDQILEQGSRTPVPAERPLADPYVNVPNTPSRPSLLPYNVTTAAPELPRKKSFISRHWWIIPVSTALVAGMAVGIYFAVKPDDPVGCGQASLGCLPVMPR